MNLSMSVGSAKTPSGTARMQNSGVFADLPRKSALRPIGAHSNKRRNSQILIWLFF
jgi:hypothetical protein